MEMIKCRVTAAINVGGREKNQDNLRLDTTVPYVDPDTDKSYSTVFDSDITRVFCVCDGMGGEAMGEIASITALEAIENFLCSCDTIELISLTDLAQLAAEAANSAVAELYTRMKLRGGCTLTMLILRGNEYCSLNIGDSPAFVLSDGVLREISLRHNLEEYKRLQGLEADEGDSSVLLYYLGMPQASAKRLAHIHTGSLGHGDCLLICSDGVTNAWHPPALIAALEAGARAEDLVNCAIRLEHADNCTAVLLRCERQ